MAAVTDVLLVGLDTETTGVDTARDRVVQLGVVAQAPNRLARVSWECLVNPGIPIPLGATAVHQITDAMVAAAPSFEGVAEVLRAWVSEPQLPGRDTAEAVVLVGYNLFSYDLPLIVAEYQRIRQPPLATPGYTLDLLLWARWGLRALESRRLTEVCAHLGVPLIRAHSAAADALAAVELLPIMIDAGMLPPDLEAAILAQAEIECVLCAETQVWGQWLYARRLPDYTLDWDDVYVGRGPRCGQALHELSAAQLDVIRRQSRLPEGVHNTLTAVQRKRAGGTSCP